MRFSEPFLFLILLIPATISQAPGDEDVTRCIESSTYAHTYPDTWKVLMDSWNYEQLLPGHSGPPIAGAVWTDVSLDNNDNAQFPFITPPYWQHGGGGICRFQAQVCGYTVGDQNNWLFTQHISKDIDSERNNYPVDVVVTITFNFQSCRERNDCNRQFKVYRYITNSPTSISDHQTTSKYTEIATVSRPETANADAVTNETLMFQLQPNQMGFYLGVQDFGLGTCLGMSRLLVYRLNCRPFQSVLVLYPDTPAPRDGSSSVDITCASDASVIGSAGVTCLSNGSWGPEIPECRCDPGFEFDSANLECDICPAGTYQARQSNTEQCEPCPGQSSSDQPGTAICPCDCNFIRHPERPGDPCTRPPSAPELYTPKPPEVLGTVIFLTWLPSVDSGGAENLHYDVYASQLNSSSPVFNRVNSEGITNTCDGGSRHCYEVPGLNPTTPYSLLVVAANNATEDPSSFSNVTMLGGRFLTFVVETNDRVEESSGLSSGAAAGITFILTLAFTAVITALITLVIVYYVLRRGASSSSPSSSSSNAHTANTRAAAYKSGHGVDIKTHDIYNPTNPELSEGVENPSYTVKPVAPSRPVPHSRPTTAPPKPPATASPAPGVPSRPAPPSRPPYSPPKPQQPPRYRPQNGY